MNTKNTKTSKKIIKHSNDRALHECLFKLFGVYYVARHPGSEGCEDCAFFDGEAKCGFLKRPPCDSARRKDGRDVVFVRADEKLAVELFRELRFHHFETVKRGKEIYELRAKVAKLERQNKKSTSPES